MRLRHLVFVPSFALVACSGGGETTAPENPVDAAAAPAAPAAAPMPIPEGPGFVTAGAAFRVQPVEDDKIEVNGKKVSNYLPPLYRGQQISLMKVEGDWAQVKTSDDQVGFTKADRILSGAKVALSTNLEEIKTFKRPELASVDKRTLPPASVLLVVDTKDTFTKVNVGPTSEVWVMSDKLTIDPNETGAAVLVNQARAAEARKDGAETAKQLWEVAKSTFASTAVMQQLATAAATPTEAPAEGAVPQAEN